MFFSQHFSLPCQYHSTIAPHSSIHLPPTPCNVFLPVLQFSPVSIIPPLLPFHPSTYHPCCIMFFSLYFSFPCQYHSTIAPCSFIHLPPTLYNVSFTLLHFSPVSIIPKLTLYSFLNRVLITWWWPNRVKAETCSCLKISIMQYIYSICVQLIFFIYLLIVIGNKVGWLTERFKLFHELHTAPNAYRVIESSGMRWVMFGVLKFHFHAF